MEEWFQAVESGDLDAISRMIKQGENVDRVNKNLYDITALMMAAHNGNLDVIKLLLQGGANPDIQSDVHNTALIMATYMAAYPIT